MADKIDAVVAGLTCLDITPVFISPEVAAIEEILVPSKTIQVGPADIHVGGCVSNTGLAMCQFGAKVRLMGKVGGDDFGKIILRQYKQYTSTDSMVISEKEGTAYSVVLTPKGVDRIFLHYPGCNDTLGPENIDFETVKQAKLFHFGYPPDLRRMYENDGIELVQIYKKAKECGVTTCMDTCGVDEHGEGGKKDWVKILKDVIPYLDIFVPSVEELCFMMDRDLFRKWTKRAGHADIASTLTREDVKPLADTLLSWGAKILLIKCGTAGIYFATGHKDVLCDVGNDLRDQLCGWSDAEHFELCYKPDRFMTAIGAGDTCIAAFLTAILRGDHWQQCLKYAAAAGASCVENVDALSGLRSFEEMDKKIAQGWEKI